MDALALLCNLYGDGPATLMRLKSAGFSSVESLDDIGASGLADTLETTEAAARRFLREARLLGERMVESGFEEEARPPIATHGAGPVPIVELEERASRDRETVAPSAEPPVEPGPEPSLEPAPEQAREEAAAESAEEGTLVKEVLNSWRKQDTLVEGDWEEPLAESGAESAGESGTPLELRLLDGLSGAWCTAFSELGIRTVEELAEMDTLHVAEQLGEGLTRLDRFRFLARRHLSEQLLGGDPAAVLVPRPPAAGEVAPAALVSPATPVTPVTPVTKGPSGALGTEPWPAAPPEAVKFSLSGTPFSQPPTPLARELDRAGELRDADAGSAGPFG